MLCSVIRIASVTTKVSQLNGLCEHRQLVQGWRKAEYNSMQHTPDALS
jgi:hypothetical protein